LDWDPSLLRIFGVPRSCLPQVLASDADFGETDLPFLRGVKIHGIAGDQQASLFGHRCFRAGDVKNTYGTGCFLLRNIGNRYAAPPKGILGTVAWSLGGKVTYAHEGAVLVAGAVVQFLRDQLGIVAHAGDTEALALSLSGNDGVYFVPAFAGLGTPHWDPGARGVLVGLTRGTTKAHVARAALEGIAFQILEVCEAFGSRPRRLRVDGGGSHNRFLMQFQADLLGAAVEVSDNTEGTALGAAMIAALGSGAASFLELEKLRLPGHRFEPAMKAKDRAALVKQWRQAVERAKGWAA
jgi:glycerol kinase